MTPTKTALILGATGGIGGEVALALSRRGWRINALNRDPAKLPHHGSPEGTDRGDTVAINWIRGDALNPADVIAGAEGAALIVHAVNPPGYRNWSQLVLPMLESSIQAARASGARILLPGTIYNYGPDAFPLLHEDSPQNPLTRKGKIRAEMERRLQQAARTGVRSLIVRAGDFFGPRAGNNWFSQGLIRPGKPVSAISYPGARGLGHAWAYLPDLAETMIRLIESESALAVFERFHFAGQWDTDGTQMTAAIRAAASAPNGTRRIPVRSFPWPLVTLLSPAVTLFHEMREMRYLWREPLQLSNAKLLGVLGGEIRTPLREAVRDTLTGLGCLRRALGTV
jgi:nucleoside-diphosphate-sugar epimerase